MNKIEKLLSTGDLRSAGNSEKVVKQVLAKPELLSAVVNALFIENPNLRMRASDALEKITITHPEWLKPFKKIILSEIIKIEQKEVRWHLAQILPRLNLTKIERKKIYDLMQEYLKDKSSIVKTFAMQAMTDIALQDKSYMNNVRKQIKQLMMAGTPAMQSRGKKLLVLLEKK